MPQATDGANPLIGNSFSEGSDPSRDPTLDFIEVLIARLRPPRPGNGAPAMVAVAATGGLKSVVAASLGAARLPVVVVNPAQVRAFAQAPRPRHWASGRRPIRSMRPGVSSG